MLPRILFAVLALATCFSSCKDEDDLDPALFGTWNVTRVEGQQYVNGAAGLILADPSPSGYVRFDSDGTGEQNYYYTLFGTVYPNVSEFRWEADDNNIRIDRFTEPDMVWRRGANEANRQVATYNIVVNSSQNWDYILTMER